jgi:polyribonucleotide 5'-hydroxyl-kinase
VEPEDSPHQPTASTSRTIALQRLGEWRFSVPRSSTNGVKVRLTSGTAERDGTELLLNKTYTFVRGTKSKLLTWHGCTLDISGDDCDHSVANFPVAENSAMVGIMNLHLELHSRRQKAAATKRSAPPGPRVMVCGAADSGKTSMVRMLAALATKMGSQPLVANVDPSQGLLSLPGTLSAAVFASRMDVEEPAGGFGVCSTHSSGPSAVPVKLPVVYYFGRAKVEEDVSLWRDLAGKLASSVRAKLSEDDTVRAAGLLLDTPAVWENDVERLVHAAKEFAGA